MHRLKVFLFLMCVGFSPCAWGESKILYLTNGDTIEGEIVGESETRFSLKLKSGVTISINREEVQSIETAESIAEMEPEPVIESEEPPPDVNLQEIFKAVNPTPTPIPINRLGSLTIRKKFKVREYRASLLPKDTGKQSQEPVRAIPMIPEQDDEGNRNFGIITYIDPGPKVRQGEGGWELAESNQLLNPLDEVNTIEGRLEITTQPGNLIRLDPNSELRLDRNRCDLTKGKIWVQTFSRNPAAIDFGNVSLKLQPNGLIHIETLRSGHKISILEGQIRVNNKPETPRLLKSVQGPSSVWVDGENTLTEEKEVESVMSARWDEWQRKIAEASPSPGSSGEVKDSSGEQNQDAGMETAKNLLLNIAEALSRFHVDQGSFPLEQPNFIEALTSNPGIPTWKGPYLENPTPPFLDPWGREIVYRILVENGETVAGVYSSGPNQEFEEGEGDDLGILVPAPTGPAN